MGYLPPQPPPRLNVDKHGSPRDYATYMWLTYRRHVDDRSPARIAFLHGPRPKPTSLQGGLYEIVVRMQETIMHGLYVERP